MNHLLTISGFEQNTMLSNRCSECKEYDENLIDGLCEDCQLNVMLLALAKRCRDVPLTTPHESYKWLQMLKFQATEILKNWKDE